jgi:hypothetical protein
MQLTLEIPDDLVSALRAAHGDNLPRAAIEQLAVEGYRSGKLSRFQVQQLLGFDNRWDAEAWLGKKGLNLNYSAEDLVADVNFLSGLPRD